MDAASRRTTVISMSQRAEDGPATPAPAAPDSPARLSRVIANLRAVLCAPLQTDRLPERVGAIARDLRAAVSADADQALFEIHRHGGRQHGMYSVVHALQCAVACDFIARGAGWPQGPADSLIKAALTMNISITELQGVLATQPARARLTAAQAEAIVTHPARGADLLREAGVTDTAWLQAVLEHHERSDGRGYPRGMLKPSAQARTLRTIDEFFAKISARASRPAMPLQRAARQLYAEPEGRAIVEALVREFGLFPPGTYVRLANGDLGIVLRRGQHVHTPLAVVVANRNGERLPRRVYRDTSDSRYAVVIASNMGNRHQF
jgi:HD-GYP domain-containing protein (c-di-GMP phosphodiesterase class II)